MGSINLKPLSSQTKPAVEIPIKKVVWTYLPILFLVAGLGLFINQIGRQQRFFTRASGGATLSMALEKRELNAGEEFSVDIILDPRESLPASAYIALAFMPDELELIDAGQTHQKLTLDETAEVRVLGSVRFRALKPTQKAEIMFSSETWVADKDNENLLNRTISISIIVH